MECECQGGGQAKMDCNDGSYTGGSCVDGSTAGDSNCLGGYTVYYGLGTQWCGTGYGEP